VEIDIPPGRGRIRNREFASILRDFSGLRWGKITPTDIDAFLDFGNKAFVFVESKFHKTSLQGGQKLALERLVDAAPMPAILIVAEHECEAGSDIELGNNNVVQYRLNKRWRKPVKNISVRAAIDAFLVFLKISPPQ